MREPTICWVCGEEVYSLAEFEADDFHSPCLRQAEEIDEGFRRQRQHTVAPTISEVRW